MAGNKSNIAFWVIGAGILALLIISHKTNAATPGYIPGPTDESDPQVTPASVAVISDYDNSYDYKWQTGRWYTRHKGSSTWIDVMNNLSDQDYQVFNDKMNQYLNK